MVKPITASLATLMLIGTPALAKPVHLDCRYTETSKDGVSVDPLEGSEAVFIDVDTGKATISGTSYELSAEPNELVLRKVKRGDSSLRLLSIYVLTLNRTDLSFVVKHTIGSGSMGWTEYKHRGQCKPMKAPANRQI